MKNALVFFQQSDAGRKELDNVLMDFVDAFDSEYEAARDLVESVEDMDQSIDFRVGIVGDGVESVGIGIENITEEEEVAIRQIAADLGMLVNVEEVGNG
jgi:hypothetical protein